MAYEQRRSSDQQRLDQTFSHAYAAIRESGWDAQLQSSLTRYLCVLVSGYVEQAIRDIYREYVDDLDERAARYVGKGLESQIQTPKGQALINLARQFATAWAKDLEEYLDEERKQAIDGIVDNRNRIAHGDPTDVGFHTVAGWYETAKEVVSFVEGQCGLGP